MQLKRSVQFCTVLCAGNHFTSGGSDVQSEGGSSVSGRRSVQIPGSVSKLVILHYIKQLKRQKKVSFPFSSFAADPL